MATPITKHSGVDNITPRTPGTCEVWYFGKHADIEHETGRVLNDEGVPRNCQAFKIATEIALDTKLRGKN